MGRLKATVGRHNIRRDTIEALSKRKISSLRKLAVELGFPSSFAATLSDILNAKHENVSLETENRVRVALGLEPIGAEPVEYCPSCGQIHALGDCGGKRGELVIVAEHEAVIDIKKCRPVPISTNGRGRRRRRPAIRLGVGDAEFYEQLNEERKRLGMTWGEYLRHLCGKKR